MTFTYVSPSNSELEEVRFLIGDTVEATAQLTDEEITYLLTSEGSVNAAAIAAARSLQAKYARLVDKSVDGLKLSYSQAAKQYAALITSLQRRQAIKVGGVVTGGQSKARKETVESNDDRVHNAFVRGQFDYDTETDEYSNNNSN